MKPLFYKILAGYFFDLALGDPRWFPHPVRGIGYLIKGCEWALYRIKQKKIAGCVLACIVVGIVYAATFLVAGLNSLLDIFLICLVFATRSLGEEAREVYRRLVSGDVAGARDRIARLVSRDTKGMDQKEIVRAAVETVAENIVDGIIAPLFFLCLGGIPLAFAYKAASTLDSMVGYKNERYLEFGWASARLDDWLNLVPARITGFVLVPLAAALCREDWRGSFEIVMRDRLKHASPNSGHPEAAVAGALGVRLGGETSYFGKRVKKPTIGDATNPLEASHIVRTIRLMYASSLLGLVAGLGCMYLYYSGGLP